MTIGWQPINTAPKDGTAIIAYGLCIANIEDAFGPMMAVVAYNPHAHGGSYPWSFEGGGPYPTSMNATHWMPLPDRPQTATVTQTNPDTEPAPIGAPVRDIDDRLAEALRRHRFGLTRPLWADMAEADRRAARQCARAFRQRLESVGLKPCDATQIERPAGTVPMK